MYHRLFLLLLIGSIIPLCFSSIVSSHSSLDSFLKLGSFPSPDSIMSSQEFTSSTASYSVPNSDATPVPVARPLRDGFINLAHLQHLTELVKWNGEPVALVHIYSEAPNYGWVDASGEGIACVDDVARAALVYLLYYQRTGDAEALELARAALNFVLFMQAEDGEYYNFVLDRDGTINREGPTSFKSWSWWAARAQWALASAIPVFQTLDPDYAARLEAAYLRGEAALADTIGPVGAYNQLHDVSVPAWLIGNGSDLSALAVIGLATYYETNPNSRTRHLMTNLANGIVNYRLGDSRRYPFGAFPSTTTSTALWHAWGSHQVHALALAGRLLGRQDWIQSARAAADGFYVRLLATDFLNEMAPLPMRRGQIAYGVEVMTAGFWELFQATGDESYLRYAGLSNAWFFGNNMAGIAMYDPETGRTFDGIDGPTPFRVNRNAGAESTIEALLALLMVEDHPLVTRYYQARPRRSHVGQIVEAERARRVVGAPVYGRRGWTGEARFSNDRFYALRRGDAISAPVEIEESGAYLLYASHLLRAAPKPERVVQAARVAEPIQIDGDLGEWSEAQWVAVDRPENILRGASAWPGPEKAAFHLAFLWDETHLYIAARVFDEQHLQNEVGPSVWRGDALWLYFNLLGDRRSLDAKLTLAQTPMGPQVWNWRAQGFQPEAKLAWAETENGYRYEAAISWKSLNNFDPSKRSRLYFDAGMGFGLNGFINWSGLDPDTPSNLLPLDFVQEIDPLQAEASTQTVSPLDVAFSIALTPVGKATDQPLYQAVVPQATSPDRDYLWLDLVFDSPVELEAGKYDLYVAYAGTKDTMEAVVDAFWVLPRHACKVFDFPAEHELRTARLCHDLWSGDTQWQEQSVHE
uniref:Carbohydrate-binding domain-containing protein n=1 Tax=Caldilinea aerophila TaxID=133453 RepID=A0A7C1J9J7_9CHLR